MRRCLIATGFVLVAATTAAAQTRTVAPRVRPGRIIGVFDAQSGAPLDDVTVTNTLNGLSARTSATGTLSLFFVDTVGGLLRLAKVGYRPIMMLVPNSDADSVPETIVMERAAARLAPVVTTARAHRGPADTVSALEKNGFYDRRLTSGAPTSAFQTWEKLQGLTLLSDVSRLSARQVCLSNLYINGVRVTGTALQQWEPGRVSNHLRSNPVDQLVTAHEALGIEMYRPSEVPVQYNITRPPGQPDCGATLIWTR